MTKLQLFPFAIIRVPINSINYAFNFGKYNSSTFNEGIFLASQDFWNELQKDNLNQNKKKKSKLSIAKYWLRSSIRCTPYGTFAGVAYSKLEDVKTEVIIAHHSEHKRKIRLDMEYMADIYSTLQSNRAINEEVTLYCNNTIYDLPNHYRYITFYNKNGSYRYNLSSIIKSSYTTAVLDKAKGGATLRQLVILLAGLENVPYDVARNFIFEMITSQVLIPATFPNITGCNPFNKLINTLSDIESASELTQKLKVISTLLNNEHPRIQDYKVIENRLRDLNLETNKFKNIFQTDLYLKTKKCTLDRRLLERIVSQAEDLLVLSRHYPNNDLENFKKRFIDKYEEAEIPLSIALDPELGVGYSTTEHDLFESNELLDDIFIPNFYNGSNKHTHNYLSDYTTEKFEEFVYSGKQIIELKENELAQLKTSIEDYKFPKTMFLQGSLIRRNNDKNDNYFFDLGVFSGPSGANLLARFAYGDNEIHEGVRQILKQEESECPDAIYAEVVHLSKPRAGNIVLRPIFRDYEIPVLQLSGTAVENQIFLNDITVQVKNDEVIIKSSSLKRRIIPRLTNAHNYAYQALPVYKFLCDLQFQGLASFVMWDWGDYASFRYLPRVVYKDIILKKAKWEIKKKDIDDNSSITAQASLNKFRQKWNIPNEVLLTDDDNFLLLNFNKEMCVELFFQYLKKNGKVVLEESLHNVDSCIVRDEKGNSYVNEIILPVALNTENKKQVSLSNAYAGGVKRKYLPNSEWTYIKIYCGNKTAEKVLCNILLPFVKKFENNLFDKFFFIRYRDDFPHLRVRFFNPNLDNQQIILSAFVQELQPMVDAQLINKIVVDTYERELERYHPDLIEEAETLFSNDSYCVLKMLDILNSAGNEKDKLLWAIRSVLVFLNDFGLTIDQKISFSKTILNNYLNEFKHHPNLSKSLDKKYRIFQKDIFSLTEAKISSARGEDLQKILIERSIRNKLTIDKIMLVLDNIDHSYRISILGSHVHMFVNRFFAFQQRKHELVIYHFLTKYFVSMKAMATPLADTQR